MLRPRLTSFFLVLCWALGAAAYTPCSYDAWVDGFQSCMRPCYGEQYYDAIFNTDECGNYSVGASSTKRSHLKCLCKSLSLTLQIINQSEICELEKGCFNSTRYNETQYEEATLGLGNMCSWAFGDVETCSLATSFTPMQSIMLAGLVMMVGIMVY